MLVAGFGRPVRDDEACGPRHPELVEAPGYAKDPPGVCRAGLCVCEAADYEM